MIGTFLDEDVALDTLTGQRTIGAGPLRIAVMSYFRHFDESFSDMVLMHDAFGQRVAVDLTARGHYRESMPGFAEANGQSYSIPSVFVFEFDNGAVTRLSHLSQYPRFRRDAVPLIPSAFFWPLRRASFQPERRMNGRFGFRSARTD